MIGSCVAGPPVNVVSSNEAVSIDAKESLSSTLLLGNGLFTGGVASKPILKLDILYSLG